VKILGVIPARGGSKRLPKKNIADLGGKPLFQRTLDTALASGIFTDLWVSTEDEEIGELAGKYWWKRPKFLAQDDTPTLPVIKDVFDSVCGDVIATLQPTSPFLTADDIKKSLDLLLNSNADAVTSVIDGPRDLAFRMRFANRLEFLPEIVVENGAIYWITGKALSEGQDWYSGFFYGYKMPKERSLDIDNGTDLELARHLLRLNNGDSERNSQ
jgi:CMP-N,N'-diacetyllegionaminic acid synthase